MYSVDIAFLDPPYEAGYYGEVMKTFLDYGIISDGGIVTLERAVTGGKRKGGTRREAAGGGSREWLSDAGGFDGFDLIRERRYGKTLIEILERTDRTDADRP
jgi:16S rRNA G966 N2-methylase RsmD